MTLNAAKLRIAVLFGGRSGEHEVSLMSARSVLSVLDQEKYDVIEIGITHEGAWLTGKNVLSAFEQGNTEGLVPAGIFPDPSKPGLYVFGPESQVREVIPVDVYFPVIHGTYGEDGSIQGLFEMAGAAYVGAGITGSSVGMDKGVFKSVMIACHIPVVESITVLRSRIEKDMEQIIGQAEALGPYPLFIKPANLGSSVGVTKCRTRSDAAEGLQEAARFDRRILIERGISNPREIEVSIIGNDQPQASIPGEIIPGADFYSYDAKYISDNSRLCIPAELSEKQVKDIQKYAIQAFKAIDCCGMARVDFLLDQQSGEIFLNEINTIPGFTKISMYPKLWNASGMSYQELVDRLIELAVERKNENSRTTHHFRSDL
ncbi:MAG: D-alanine--D-alanine ligase family protein [Chloroflexota bacterium]